MKDNTFYFTHDYHARNDRKLIKAKIKHGTIAIGIYWSLIEMLYEENGKISLQDCDIIATDLRSANDPELSQFCAIANSVIKDFDLFKTDDEFFWSESVKRRLAKRLEKSEKAKESIRSRWENTDVIRTNNDSNTIKERKGKEIKGKVDIAFSIFWNAYLKKKDKGKAEKAWSKLSTDQKQKAIDFIPTYFKNNTDYQFQKYPATYLNSKCWEDEYNGFVIPYDKSRNYL
jgi:hypothetical protein